MERIGDYERLVGQNRVFLKRTKDIGVVTSQSAIDMGLGGPNLRASGVDWDIRRDAPYEIYDRLEFNVVVREGGDCYDRWACRIDEMRESVRMIEQCMDQMNEGPVATDLAKVAFPVDKELLKTSMETQINHFMLSAYGFKVPKGEVYVAIEAPKGELGYYIISDGSGKPFRFKVRAPSFVNMQILQSGATNVKYLADLIAMLGSIDPVLAEVDK